MSKWWLPYRQVRRCSIHDTASRRESGCASSGQRILLYPRTGAGPSQAFPIDSFGNRFGREGRKERAGHLRRPVLFQFADRSAADHFHGPPEFSAVFGPLLAAGLKNDLVFLDFFGHGSAFAYGQGNRFLTISVFLGPGRQNRGFSMPVVRRCDEHGVDLFVGQEALGSRL